MGEQPHPGSHGAAHAAPAHELSWTPPLIGLGTLILYLSLEYRALLPVGIVVFLIPFAMWVREDVAYWRAGRIDHGVRPGRDLGWWGMIWFLGTEVMLFGGLFATFFVARGQHPDVWAAARTHLDHALPLVTINTLILVASGFTFHWALHAIRKDNRRNFFIGTIATLVLGTIFLIVQMSEYKSLMEGGITLSGSQFGHIFYLLTGTHGFHVFMGIVLIGVVLVRGLLGQFDAKRHVAVDTFAIYWHFVDVVWIMLYFIVYVGVL